MNKMHKNKRLTKSQVKCFYGVYAPLEACTELHCFSARLRLFHIFGPVTVIEVLNI